MKWVTCHGGKLRVSDGAADGPPGGGVRAFGTGVPEWDELAPVGGFARRAVHELLFDDGDPAPTFPAVVLARGASRAAGDLVWVDAERTLYPPAVAAAGVPLDRFHLVRPPPERVAWVVAECLRSGGVSAVVAVVPAGLSRVLVRRFQLAAEAGATVGLLLRPTGPGSDVYAAATRWLVRPAPGGPGVQRWDVRLTHGHGGRVGRSVQLEQRRDAGDLYLDDGPRDQPAPGAVRPPAALAGQPPAAARRASG